MIPIKKYVSTLKKTKLFAGVGEADISAMLDCLQARLQRYPKGAYIYRVGEHVAHIAVVAEGSLHIQKDDYWGNRSILNSVHAGEMVGEAFLAPDSGPLPHDIVAVEDTAMIFFDVNRILNVCSSACRFHTLVVQNLFYAISEKNRTLVQKLGHMARRTTREKLISYLSEQAQRQNSATFTIPFNRQQLADFLSVDRSAMTSELGRMRDDGLLLFDRNTFTLLEDSDN